MSSWNKEKKKRKKIREEMNKVEVCYICGINFPHLNLHHIDNNHNNNSLKNLVKLCPNCHWFVHDGVGNKFIVNKKQLDGLKYFFNIYKKYPKSNDFFWIFGNELKVEEIKKEEAWRRWKNQTVI